MAVRALGLAPHGGALPLAPHGGALPLAPHGGALPLAACGPETRHPPPRSPHCSD